MPPSSCSPRLLLVSNLKRNSPGERLERRVHKPVVPMRSASSSTRVLNLNRDLLCQNKALAPLSIASKIDKPSNLRISVLSRVPRIEKSKRRCLNQKFWPRRKPLRKGGLLWSASCLGLHGGFPSAHHHLTIVRELLKALDNDLLWY